MHRAKAHVDADEGESEDEIPPGWPGAHWSRSLKALRLPDDGSQRSEAALEELRWLLHINGQKLPSATELSTALKSRGITGTRLGQ
eukprot:14290861-Alexandrium_andersonii.AAC.1